MKPRPLPPLEFDVIWRFWMYVNRKGPNECWIWAGSDFDKGGYGRFKIDKERWLVHRVAYAIQFQRDPGELLVCHTCDNPPCVNPDHLFLGTHTDNNQDASYKGHTAVGVKHPSHKLTWNDVCEMRRLWATGLYTQERLGRLFGVVQGTVSAVVLHRQRQRE